MASLSARYAAGECEDVWRLLDRQRLPLDEIHDLGRPPDEDDVEDVLRQTFSRVASNTDRLIERLGDLGYAFQEPPPRRPATDDLARIDETCARRFADLARFYELGVETLVPRAWRVFGEIVGSADLRQSWEVESNHDDPIIACLGDWDPLVVEFAYCASELSDLDHNRMDILSEGGLAAIAEFAPSFEHKANVSGAMNYELRLPNPCIDPMVYAEGIRLPFTTYLRRSFARGGFFGVPRIVRGEYRDLRRAEVEPGIFLPDHPIFASLAEGLERF